MISELDVAKLLPVNSVKYQPVSTAELSSSQCGYDSLAFLGQLLDVAI